MESNNEPARVVRIPLPMYGPVSIKITDDMLELTVVELLEMIADQFLANEEPDKARSARSLKEQKIIIRGTEMNPSRMRVKDLAFIDTTGIQMPTGEDLSRDENPERVDDRISVTEAAANPPDHPRKDWDKAAKLVIDALWNANIIPDAAYDNAMDDMINIVAPVLKKELDE